MTEPHRARLGLGTAQFGLDYGVSNTRGRVGETEVLNILDTAAINGVTLVDTAAAYGDAERALGRSWPFPSPFQVVTKTLRLAEGLDRIEHRARRSLERLGVARAKALLVHSAEDLHGAEGRALWARLEKLKGEGLFQQIGFSAYAEDDPATLARDLELLAGAGWSPRRATVLDLMPQTAHLEIVAESLASRGGTAFPPL